MQAAVEKMETQLTLWRSQIDNLAAKTQIAGVQVRFDTIICIDELKALLAIAQSKLDGFRASGDMERTRLEVEMKSAYDELDAAFRSTKPAPQAAKGKKRSGSTDPSAMDASPD